MSFDSGISGVIHRINKIMLLYKIMTLDVENKTASAKSINVIVINIHYFMFSYKWWWRFIIINEKKTLYII